MIPKWTCAAFTLALLTGCATQPVTSNPVYTPKTPEQIHQEAVESTVAAMKKNGASQAQIDALTAYSKLSYEEQLKSRISSTKTPAENLVSLVDSGLFSCDLKRRSLKTPISDDYTRKIKRELVECVATSSQVITSYYYKSYIPSSATEAVKGTVDETYLKWGVYKDSIFNSAAPLLQDQAALGVNDQLQRTQLVFLREALKNKK
jgi:hypothetical protein